MKITEVKTFLLYAQRQNLLLVKVMTDEGVYGWGEASVEGQERSVREAVHILAQRSVIGEDPADIEKIWQKMYRHGFWKGGFIYNSAISGIDMALWDIKGKVLGVPVYELLGGKVRDKVRTYTHANQLNAEQLAELMAAGFDGVKTSGHIEPKQLDKLLDMIRGAIGPDKLLCIDHHGQSTVKDALALIKVASNYDLYFFEEPVTPENPQLYKEIVNNPWNIPIAAGERLFSRFDYRDVINNQWLDIIQPDICHCCGISEIRKIAYMAEPYLIRFAPHNPNGPIAAAASIQVCAAMPNFDILEFAQTVYRVKDLYDFNFTPKDGYFEIPTKPGLGIEIDESAFAKFPEAPVPMGGRYLSDGTPVD